MEKVTVIVPIFNSEKYLEQCLDSIINQTYTNLEILLVNDGSTDGSAQICESYASKDSRVRLIHKKMGGSGVGATRNTALSYATGDYILFVDNDDWLEINHIESLYNTLKETDSDISIANFTEYDDERQVFLIRESQSTYFQTVYKPEEWFEKQYYNFSQCFTVPWGKLYKASLFENILYPENERVEDDYTTWKVYLMADKIVFTNVSLYLHRKRPDSITKTVNFSDVFPLRSIEERLTILGLVGFDISEELGAYKWRLTRHRDSLLASGNMYEYKKILQKLAILEKYGKL